VEADRQTEGERDRREEKRKLGMQKVNIEGTG